MESWHNFHYAKANRTANNKTVEYQQGPLSSMITQPTLLHLSCNEVRHDKLLLCVNEKSHPKSRVKALLQKMK